MDHRCIRFERQDAIALVTLNRPERANAIDRTMLAELNAACDAVESDEAIRALVVIRCRWCVLIGLRPQGAGGDSA